MDPELPKNAQPSKQEAEQPVVDFYESSRGLVYPMQRDPIIEEPIRQKPMNARGGGGAGEYNEEEDRGNTAVAERPQKKATLLDTFGRDFTAIARKGGFDPLIGRDEELIRMMQILCRRTKANPVIVGDAGVGKTALVEGLAYRIANGLVPEPLENKRIVSLDLTAMVAGTMYRGQFEERVKGVMAEVKKAGDVILFIDELHTVLGAGGAEGALDASNMLKPALARGEFPCIGATTLDEFRKYIEKDAALSRRFQPVLADEPSVEETIQILGGIAPGFEAHHKVKYTPGALAAAAKHSERYIPDRKLPDKAIDVIDEAGALARLKAVQNGFNGEVLIDGDMIDDVVSKMAKVTITRVGADEAADLLDLEANLGKQVVGQVHAVRAVARACLRTRTGFSDPNRPLGSFLFLGPSGVGKTLLAKKLAQEFFGTEDALVPLDMSEYMEKGSESRLVGTSPGYIGYEEGGLLTERIRRRPYCVLLLDEFEKAHADVQNMMLQMLEEGRLTDGHGRVVHFKNVFVVMTSNVGTTDASNEGFGFAPRDNRAAQKTERDGRVMGAVEARFRPEFLNRIDNIVIFDRLSYEDMRTITDLELAKLGDRAEKVGIELEVSSEAKEFILEKGFDPNYNARPLRRAIEQRIEDPLAEKLLRGTVKKGDTVSVQLAKDQLEFVVLEKVSALAA